MDRNDNFGKRKLCNKFLCSHFILFRSLSHFMYALSMQGGVSDCLSNKSAISDWLTYKKVCSVATVRPHRGQTSEHARRIAWGSLSSIRKSYMWLGLFAGKNREIFFAFQGSSLAMNRRNKRNL